MPGARTRNAALRTSKCPGHTLWRRCSEDHRPSRAETKTHCVRLPGQRHSARDFDRAVAGFGNRIAVRNGFTAFATPVTEAVG